MKKIGEKVWFYTADGQKHRGVIDGILPNLFCEGGGKSLYAVIGPNDIGVVAITEDQFIQDGNTEKNRKPAVVGD